MKRISILIAFCLSFNAFAVDDNSVVYLPKNNPAPFSGYLITPAKADKVHDINVELKSQQKINGLLQEEQDLYVKRLQNSQAESDRLAKQLVDERDKSFFNKAGYFVLGAVLTGFISYGLVRSLK